MNYWLFHYIDRYIGIPAIFVLNILRKYARIGRKQNKGFNAGNIKRILVIKLSMLGDTVLLLPAIEALRNKYKDAEIVAVCSEINREIIESSGYADSVFVVKLNKLLNPFYLVKVLKKISEPFDITVDFEQWFRFSALLAFFSKAGFSLGFNTKKQFRHFLFDRTVYLDRDKHTVENYFDLVKEIGVPDSNTEVHLNISAEVANNALKKLESLGISKDGRFIIIHPGSSHWAQKQWPREKYIELCDRLIRKYAIKILITGTKEEKNIANYIIDRLKNREKTVYLGEVNSVNELAAILKKGLFLISGNTGVMHLAGAVKTPVLQISGPVNSVLWGPWGSNSVSITSKIPCAPCVDLGFDYKCGQRKCMENISVDEVMQACEKILGKV